MAGSIGQGLGFIAAALSTGLSALGAGIAVAACSSCCYWCFHLENKENFGKSMIFVALGEGVAIYGLFDLYLHYLHEIIKSERRIPMRFFLLSDNIDTQMGMRLAGIEGVVVHERRKSWKNWKKRCTWKMSPSF